MSKSSGESQISKFYASRSVLITGGTGFMGKVLTARLLQTCSNIKRIYLLIRHKKIVSPEERLIQLKQSQVFDIIRKQQPELLNKLKAISGDITKPQLGLHPDSFELLQDVSIVFHSAATVKFNESLKTAVEHNVLPVIELFKICDQLPGMKAFVYVSTAYCNAELDKIEERVYPPYVDFNDLMNFIKITPEPMLQQKTEEYIQPKPNTYTFTKSMAENIVAQHVNKNYSVAIFRPTLVVSSLAHPFPGWVQNVTGVPGIIVAVGAGLLHFLAVSDNVHLDLLPVDIAIDTLIAIAWEIGIEKSEEIRVYNYSNIENPTTIKKFRETFFKHLFKYPLGKPLWYPWFVTINNRHAFKLLEIIFQKLPLYAVQYIIKILRINSTIDFIKTSQNISILSEACSYLFTKDREFCIDNFKQLRKRLTKADAAIFNLEPCSINWDNFYRNFVHGTRKYVMGRNDCDVKVDQRHLQKLRLLHYSVTILIIMSAGKVFHKKFYSKV